MNQALLIEIRDFLLTRKQRHYYCDDSWYNCPKHPEGCADPRAGQECNCGAEKHNQEIDAMIEKINKNL